jgi:hypothetical protein
LGRNLNRRVGLARVEVFGHLPKLNHLG